MEKVLLQLGHSTFYGVVEPVSAMHAAAMHKALQLDGQPFIPANPKTPAKSHIARRQQHTTQCRIA